MSRPIPARPAAAAAAPASVSKPVKLRASGFMSQQQFVLVSAAGKPAKSGASGGGRGGDRDLRRSSTSSLTNWPSWSYVLLFAPCHVQVMGHLWELLPADLVSRQRRGHNIVKMMKSKSGPALVRLWLNQICACAECGQMGHLARDCPNKGAKGASDAKGGNAEASGSALSLKVSNETMVLTASVSQQAPIPVDTTGPRTEMEPMAAPCHAEGAHVRSILAFCGGSWQAAAGAAPTPKAVRWR